jgi:hypothetical protein
MATVKFCLTDRSDREWHFSFGNYILVIRLGNCIPEAANGGKVERSGERQVNQSLFLTGYPSRLDSVDNSRVSLPKLLILSPNLRLTVGALSGILVVARADKEE